MTWPGLFRVPQALAQSSRKSLIASCSSRKFHSSSPARARRVSASAITKDGVTKGGLQAPVGVDQLPAADVEEQLEDEFDDDDVPSSAHDMLREQRQVLYYMRLIEHEMPKLVAFRKPFIPPTSATPVIVRSLDYGGEEHPATAKRVVVVAVDQLPLRDHDAVHKIQLLAGPRWSMRPPLDGGISPLEGWGNGYIKISCEDFPKPAMNLKWASDTLDRLIAEANNGKADKFRNVPLDLRHIYARAKKAKKGEHLRSRIHRRPSIHDFPEEWLPEHKKLLTARRISEAAEAEAEAAEAAAAKSEE